MKRQEYIDKIMSVYSLVSVLSDKNGGKVLRVRNKSNGKDMIVRSFQNPVAAYEKLVKIKCNNLPLIYDVINLEDGQVVLEEFIEGITVAEVMESGRYKYKGAKKVLESICNALCVLENQRMVHRDIKPENVIVGNSGRVVLLDFNASREIKNADKDTVVMGTVGYAAPEQLGLSESDTRTDIYSAGILLNVMLTGYHPSKIKAKGKAGRIVDKCTAINPDDRFVSAIKLKNAL